MLVSLNIYHPKTEIACNHEEKFHFSISDQTLRTKTDNYKLAMLLGKKVENGNHGKIFFSIACKETFDENSRVRLSLNFKLSNLHD